MTMTQTELIEKARRVLGLLLAQGLALVHAWWSFNRKMAKRPIEREIETS
jgi:hypothetical protein